MAQAMSENIRSGWKVFAGPEAIGEVSYVRGQEIGVKTGRIIKHVYAVPMDLVSDASDGVVDLKIGREAVSRMTPAR